MSTKNSTFINEANSQSRLDTNKRGPFILVWHNRLSNSVGHELPYNVFGRSRPWSWLKGLDYGKAQTLHTARTGADKDLCSYSF